MFMIRFTTDFVRNVINLLQRRNHYKHIHAFHLGIKQARKFFCQICGKSFARNDILKTHVYQVHDKIREVFCQKCDKSFTRKSLLNRHMDIVHPPKKLPCPKCFKEVFQMERHMERIHDKIHEVFCQICYKAYTRKDLLIRHINVVHLGIKEVPKKVHCPKCFKEVSRIKMHTRRVHDKCYDCNRCNITFASHQKLIEHLEVVHDNERFGYAKVKYLRRNKKRSNQIEDSVMPFEEFEKYVKLEHFGNRFMSEKGVNIISPSKELEHDESTNTVHAIASLGVNVLGFEEF